MTNQNIEVEELDPALKSEVLELPEGFDIEEIASQFNIDPVAVKMEEVKLKLINMLQFQNKASSLMAGEDYFTKNLDWNSAIIAEVGELLDSAGYKWWKTPKIDIENIKVEIIDIWHFLMSKMTCDINPSSQEMISNFIPQFAEFHKGQFTSIDYSTEEFRIGMGEINNKNIIYHSKLLLNRLIHNEEHRIILISLTDLCTSVHMGFSELYDRYMVKNALNTLRQNYGQNDNNSYIRQWSIPSEDYLSYEGNTAKEVDGKFYDEDNKVALYLVSCGSPNPSFEDIYSQLENYYNNDEKAL